MKPLGKESWVEVICRGREREKLTPTQDEWTNLNSKTLYRERDSQKRFSELEGSSEEFASKHLRKDKERTSLGSVVKSLRFHFRGHEFNPWSGN